MYNSTTSFSWMWDCDEPPGLTNWSIIACSNAFEYVIGPNIANQTSVQYDSILFEENPLYFARIDPLDNRTDSLNIRLKSEFMYTS